MHTTKRMQIVASALVISGLMLFGSCEKDFVTLSDAGVTAKEPVPTDTAGTAGTGKPGTATVLFGRDLQPIFKSNCLSCHDAGSSFALDSKHAYSTVVNGGFISTSTPGSSKFFKNSIKGHPDDYLTPAEHKLFVTWMLEGALNN